MTSELAMLKQLVEETVMVAKTDGDGDGFISAYHFQTGAIHRLLAAVRTGNYPAHIVQAHQPAGEPMDPGLFFSANFLAGARMEAMHFAKSTIKENPAWFPATAGAVAINMQLLAEKVARLYAASPQHAPVLQEAREALMAVSPYNLQDCWCKEPDHGGPKPHTYACTLARMAVKDLAAAIAAAKAPA